jgi:hypothetical protein
MPLWLDPIYQVLAECTLVLAIGTSGNVQRRGELCRRSQPRWR